jgi:hypothetical protein
MKEFIEESTEYKDLSDVAKEYQPYNNASYESDIAFIYEPIRGSVFVSEK